MRPDEIQKRERELLYVQAPIKGYILSTALLLLIIFRQILSFKTSNCRRPNIQSILLHREINPHSLYKQAEAVELKSDTV